jgi:hypothetical protein
VIRLAVDCSRHVATDPLAAKPTAAITSKVINHFPKRIASGRSDRRGGRLADISATVFSRVGGAAKTDGGGFDWGDKPSAEFFIHYLEETVTH